MTDTLDTPSPEIQHRPPVNPTTVVLAIVAAVAVVGLVVVAIVATARDDGPGRMMPDGQMPGSMMDNGHMMNGSMMGRGATSPTVPGARELAVSASSFRFTPSEMHVRAGEDVTIVLTSTDVVHDFTIDELDVHIAAAPGSTRRGGLRAPGAPGRYTAYCSVAGHRAAGMTATVVVDAT